MFKLTGSAIRSVLGKAIKCMILGFFGIVVAWFVFVAVLESILPEDAEGSRYRDFMPVCMGVLEVSAPDGGFQTGVDRLVANAICECMFERFQTEDSGSSADDCPKDFEKDRAAFLKQYHPYTRLSKDGDLPTFASYGNDMLSIDLYVSEIDSMPIERCLKRSEERDPDAAYCLYRKYEGDEGMTMLRRAAELGHPLAQNNLAMFMAKGGQGVDSEEIVRLMKASAEYGIPHAQVTLGRWYMKGLYGLPVDYFEARKWNMAGYQQGHPEGANNLGALYAQDISVPANFAQAKSWYEQAGRLSNQVRIKD